MKRPRFTLRWLVVAVAVAGLATWGTKIYFDSRHRAQLDRLIQGAEFNRKLTTEWERYAAEATDPQMAARYRYGANAYARNAAAFQKAADAARRRYGFRP